SEAQPGGTDLLPSKADPKTLIQSLLIEEPGVVVATTVAAKAHGTELRSRVESVAFGEAGICRIDLRALSQSTGWLAVSLRPYNPEGVSFIHDVALDPRKTRWTVNGFPAVEFSEAAARHYSSEYHLGDVYHKVRDPDQGEDSGSHCKVGLATAVALFPLHAGIEKELVIQVDLSGDKETPKQFPVRHPARPWQPALAEIVPMRIPDEQFDFLYRAAVRTLLLHSPGEVFPGPYTYKRFWFRDAAFILNAMLAVGMTDRVERALDLFPSRQTMGGYFLSQEGEWDSNGEALWIMRRWCETMGCKPKPGWMDPIAKAAEWVLRKRIKESKEPRVKGLFPAGFSAEHLGPNDYYYWDDFWGVAGLLSAAWLLERAGSPAHAGLVAKAKEQAADFLTAIEDTLAAAHRSQHLAGAIPASPLRRMDSGAIGSIVAGFPLSLWPGDDTRLLATLEFLLAKCMYQGTFFQDMIHSGMNAYLTLHMAQSLLRAGDARFFDLIRATAAVASPTGQWPEAIHPHTLGGCMGDGQHVWAAAEWVMMMRNLFLREEGRTLILASGIPDEWLVPGTELSFGPGPTLFGLVTVLIKVTPESVKVSWSGQWLSHADRIEVKPPGKTVRVLASPGDGFREFPRQ
ncbi:MAG: hypothetical protein ABI036_12445, partial [Fibrobacteria bacterium]